MTVALSVFESFSISCIYLLVVALLVRFVNFTLTPVIFLGKGPVLQPGFAASFVSSMLFSVSSVVIERQSSWLRLIISVAFLLGLLALLPISGGQVLYFERPDLLFSVFYICGRMIYSLELKERKALSRSYLNFAALSLLALFCIISLLGINRGGGTYVAELSLHLSVFATVGQFISFLCLFFGSEAFFYPKPVGISGINFVTLPHHISKIVWFSLLSWLYVGVVVDSAALSFLLFVSVSLLLRVAYEFFDQWSVKISLFTKYRVTEQILVPIFLVSVLLAWIEKNGLHRWLDL